MARSTSTNQARRGKGYQTSRSELRTKEAESKVVKAFDSADSLIAWADSKMRDRTHPPSEVDARGEYAMCSLFNGFFKSNEFRYFYKHDRVIWMTRSWFRPKCYGHVVEVINRNLVRVRWDDGTLSVVDVTFGNLVRIGADGYVEYASVDEPIDRYYPYRGSWGKNFGSTNERTI